MCPDHKTILTEDGSPSIVTTYENGVTEKMHHFRGALTESIYVYVPAVEWSFTKHPCPSVMSLGLGLGYNELLTVAAAIRHCLANQMTLVTFESDEGLKDHFKNWLLNIAVTPLDATYTQIIEQIAQAENVSPEILKSSAAALLKAGLWSIRGSFPEELTDADRFGAILYDAFSSKMDGPLWSEELLKHFLMKHAAPECAFATYASTGALKRALKANGFQIQSKSGFGGKKECTFSIRDLEKSGFLTQS